MELTFNVSLTTKGQMVFILFTFFTWIQCITNPPLREVQVHVGGSVTITCYYDTYEFKGLKSSWCQQITQIECFDIVDSGGNIRSNSHIGRVTVSLVLAKKGSVIVTMTELNIWDTGLYKWVVWDGRKFDVIENILLMVVEGLPSSLQVLRLPVSGEVDMHCSYNQMQRWSKIWCKFLNPEKCEWMSHSGGDVTSDYRERVIATNNHKEMIMTQTLRLLELWDSGLYQCQEAGGQTVLNKLLLIVTPEIISREEVTQTVKLETAAISTYQTTTTQTHLPEVTQAVKLETAALSTYQTTTTQTHLPGGIHYHTDISNTTTPKSRVAEMKYRAWDILRWLLFLAMVIFLLFFRFYEKFSGMFYNLSLFKEPTKSRRY